MFQIKNKNVTIGTKVNKKKYTNKKNHKYTQKQRGRGFGIFGNKNIVKCSSCSLLDLFDKKTIFMSKTITENPKPVIYYHEYYDTKDLTKYESYKLEDTSLFFSIEGIQKPNVIEKEYPNLLFKKNGKFKDVHFGYFIHLVKDHNGTNPENKIIRRFFNPFKIYNFKIRREREKESKQLYYIIENFDYNRNSKLLKKFTTKSPHIYNNVYINYVSFQNFKSLFNYLQIFEIKNLNNINNTNHSIMNDYKGTSINLVGYNIFLYHNFDPIQKNKFNYFLVGIVDSYNYYIDQETNEICIVINPKINPIITEPYSQIGINSNRYKNIFLYNFTIEEKKPEGEEKIKVVTEGEVEPEFILDHYNKCIIIVHSKSENCDPTKFIKKISKTKSDENESQQHNNLVIDPCYLFNKLVTSPFTNLNMLDKPIIYKANPYYTSYQKNSSIYSLDYDPATIHTPLNNPVYSLAAAK